ncbi:MAG: Ldh family oxidoreductase, partial [Candidatus Poribacteria bacterium]|nr:Ldh family oxidoreductase [Candidatus Poribacteria bacterium]
LETYYDEVDSLIKHVKSSRLAPGFDEILAPGEPEFRSAQRKEIEGIAIDETTWAAICEAARGFGLDPDRWQT